MAAFRDSCHVQIDIVVVRLDSLGSQNGGPAQRHYQLPKFQPFCRTAEGVAHTEDDRNQWLDFRFTLVPIVVAKQTPLMN